MKKQTDKEKNNKLLNDFLEESYIILKNELGLDRIKTPINFTLKRTNDLGAACMRFMGKNLDDYESIKNKLNNSLPLSEKENSLKFYEIRINKAWFEYLYKNHLHKRIINLFVHELLHIYCMENGIYTDHDEKWLEYSENLKLVGYDIEPYITTDESELWIKANLEKGIKCYVYTCNNCHGKKVFTYKSRYLKLFIEDEAVIQCDYCEGVDGILETYLPDGVIIKGVDF